MPIKLDKELPALDILRKENVFIMDNKRAKHQDIRPMDFLIVNLMPTKEVTETQLLRLLANTPLQINVEFLYMTSHESKNTTAEHLETFYKTFDDVRHKYYDGLIITGAPIETLDYEEVDYWSELCQIFDWSKTHVYSTLHLCWGAQAGLYYKYGIKKVLLDCKLSGVFSQDVVSLKILSYVDSMIVLWRHIHVIPRCVVKTLKKLMTWKLLRLVKLLVCLLWLVKICVKFIALDI